MSNSIKVVCRFRPQNRIENEQGAQPVVKFEADDTCALDVGVLWNCSRISLHTTNIKNSQNGAAGSFTFDRVFGMSSRQKDIFDFSIKPTVDDILNGYNGTVLFRELWSKYSPAFLSSPGTIEYTVRVSYMEIYMERIRDLLQPQNDNLPIHEEKNRGVYVKGLLEVYVSSVQEVYENLLDHIPYSLLQLHKKNVETGSAKSGQLFLVDLAGSEKVGKTGASGQTLEEAKKINKSLSALGMVINNLTDGKSSHIPYRDSKLTRILQESLGGNSRTTLIINCSPSSYNAEETLSTLRFGMRAKAIKNKAKVNAELSPAELKALLRKAQSQVTTFETYVSTLEGEVQLWRKGESVPKEQWAPPLAGVSGAKAEAARAPRPSTPSRLATESRAETPGPERSATPGLPIDKDEREEFLRRENELQDQITEKETQIAAAEKTLRDTKEELTYLKERDTKVNKDNEKLTGEANEFKMQLERLAFESKEAQITMDSLKEANAELTAELDELKQQLLNVKMSAKESTAALDEKEKRKAEKMAQMMAGFDLGGEVFSENEATIKKVIEHVDTLYEQSASGEAIPPDEFEELKAKLVETQGIVRQAELSMFGASSNDANIKRREELEQRLQVLEQEYEDLLERNLGEGDVAEIKERLEKAYSNNQDIKVELVEDLKKEVAQKTAEIEKFKAVNEDLQQRVKSGGASNGTAPSTAKFDA
ncbi:hypothetical protein EYC84_002643 [Monilinia fructicola]|uniref:Kinesin-like protein n=1 Tax=Monilinia fructicola TaxID=38448 RepID=A0A5M9JLJ1_MONFR|nr:hypothetical protein EYC84_002643 [Monilinia fructicola]